MQIYLGVIKLNNNSLNMCLKYFSYTFFFFAIISGIRAEQNSSFYFIYLKDKPISEYSIAQPIKFLSQKAIDRRVKKGIPITREDLPVDLNYINQINGFENCRVVNKSKWLNAIEIELIDTQVLQTIKALPFVIKVQYLGTIKRRNQPELPQLDSQYLNKYYSDSFANKQFFEANDYGSAFEQNNLIDILPLHNRQYLGSGISIAIIDAGFQNVYKTPGMNFKADELVMRDFVTHDNSVWEDDRHGANCLSFMKTFNPGTYIGSAPKAKYILLRSEEAASEYPTEEVNWLAAAEFADSMGVDLISSSLGYNTFNEKSLNHSHKDLNGQTSIIAKAANIAWSKGIFVVVSAGNEGKNEWHKIGTPSDAQGVLTIGAVDADGYHADFSSYGPSADGRIKPDFMAMGKKAMVASSGGTYTGNGTSYATPLFAGALACLIQACPNKSFEEVKIALQLSSTHAAAPDSAYGYGMPDMALAALILGNNLDLDTSKDIFWQGGSATYFQNQSIHFKSHSDQIVEIRMSGMKKGKVKIISSQKILIKKGNWLHNCDLFLLLNNHKKIKKRKQYKSISLDLMTANATYQRSFTLSY